MSGKWEDFDVDRVEANGTVKGVFLCKLCVLEKVPKEKEGKKKRKNTKTISKES